MSALFRNPVFTRLFLANFASQLGTVVGNMAFAYYLVDHFSTRPALAATAELMYSLPTLAVFWLVGVIADLLDRARIAVYSDWIRAGLTLLLLVALHSGLLPLCFLLLFLRSAVAKFFGPAEMGLLQGSIGREQYVQAAGLNQMIMGLFMLFGMSLGAFAYRFLGIEGALLIDGISFLLSGLLILSCRFHEDVRMPGGRHVLRDIRFPRLIGDFLEGLRYIRSHKLLLTLISGFLFFGIVNGVFAVLPIFTMKYKLSPDSYMLHASLITLCLGTGFLAGSVAASPLIRRFTRTRVLITGLLMSSLLIIALGSANSVWVYLPLVLIEGLCIAPVNIAIGSWMPELVIPKNMGRVNALIEPIMMLGHSLALGLVALAFPAIISVTWLHYLLAVCTLLVCVYYAFALPPLVRRLALDNAAASAADRAS